MQLHEGYGVIFWPMRQFPASVANLDINFGDSNCSLIDVEGAGISDMVFDMIQAADMDLRADVRYLPL